MNDSLHFDNGHLFWTVLIGALLLLLVFIWKEWTKGLNLRFMVNSMMATISVLALGCLFLKPLFYTESIAKGVVLTKGYDSKKLDSLDKVVKGLKRIVYYPGKSVKQELSGIAELAILGEGIHPFDFWQFDAPMVHYSSLKLPQGIVKLKYKPNHTVGDSLQIKATYRYAPQGRRLCLETLGGKVVDSIILSDKFEQDLALKSPLKTSGKFVYQITEKDSLGKVIRKNPIPVVVSEKERLKILIVNGFPSFETKYLKNFLAEEGHQVVVRSQITKQKYKFEYFNTEIEAVYGFAENDLKSFDLLIIDAPTYLNLSRKLRNTIDKIIQSKALGLFVQPNNVLFKRLEKSMDIKVSPDKVGTISLSSDSKTKLQKYPYRFETPHLKADTIKGYGYLRLEGQGKKGTTLMKNTYELVLKGKTKAYRQIWTNIINKLSRRSQNIGEFQADQQFAFQNQPYEVALYSELDAPGIQHKEGYELPIIRSILQRDFWQVKTYPRNKGWNSIRLAADTTIVHDYFVLDTSQWRALTSERIIQGNNRHFGKKMKSNKKIRVLQKIPLIWFFILFLLSTGYLWLEPKLRKPTVE